MTPVLDHVTLPRGVHRKPDSHRYAVQMRVYGRLQHVGVFDTVAQAEAAYRDGVAYRAVLYARRSGRDERRRGADGRFVRSVAP